MIKAIITNLIIKKIKSKKNSLKKLRGPARYKYNYMKTLKQVEAIDAICESTYKDLVITEAEYQGKKVKLNDPIRGGSKKFYVYVKNAKGNIVKVSFGDTTGLSIKRDDPARRKSFRARHNCDTAKDKTTARYWSCYQWRAGAKVNN